MHGIRVCIICRSNRMTYRITGLDPATFAHLAGASDAELAAHDALRVTADTAPGFPCRVSLTDARPGETLLLLNHVSHDVATPYRSSYAIYVREQGAAQADYRDCVPPVLVGRPIGLRAFDAGGMLKGAALAMPGQADAKIREVFADPDIAYIHAHNAAHGCFAARVDRA
jgi:Protein of unknown function (DUF1203)